ncbi:HTTM domain-containing protein [Natrialba chahannaoensis JCM 10990]|uniref:HTTM domain-containing protein n=1 Tax=Natrialba chahannaoensis JCM 10990 TaxID=1227492 RepID=M0AJJ0_9EURY|nr:HTTM domain-containing protein [Natrialba chahannaoensis]ELY98516.1 HTTM domain-containing protein [Natrialba chahannaoensis JCM 10990]
MSQRQPQSTLQPSPSHNQRSDASSSSPSAATTGRDRLDRGLEWIGSALQRRFAIDRRALAAFRITLGLLLLVDLAMRARQLDLFYTDAGVLPLAALFSDYSSVYSLHALSGSAWVQGLLFLIAGLFAFALILGYRTRFVTIVSWLLLVSLHIRNPMVLNGGDILLRLLLLWSVFLPLGSRWSVDARRFDTPRRGETTLATIGTIAILVQVLLMYVTNAIHKTRSDPWMGGDAVVHIFQADHLTILLGNTLADATALLELFTYAWMVMIVISPLLLLLTGIPRALLATGFVGMHLGMLVTLRIDLFPLIVVAGLLLFYPPIIWDWAERLAQRIGLASPLRGVLEWCQTTLPVVPFRVPGTGGAEPVRTDGAGTGEDDGDADGDESENEGENKNKSESESENHDETGAAHDDETASSDPKPQPDTDLLATAIGYGRLVAVTVIPWLLLVLVILSNAEAVDYTEVPDPGDQVLDTLQADQSWRMFAPNPTSTAQWFVVPGELADGSEVDALHGGEVDWDRPPNVDETYDTSRERKYLSNMRFAGNENHHSYFANHLCGRWNSDDSSPDLDSLTVYGMSDRSGPYEDEPDISEIEIIEYDCSGEFIQDDDGEPDVTILS